MKRFVILILCLLLSGCAIMSKKCYNNALALHYQAGVGQGLMITVKSFSEGEFEQSMEIMNSSDLAVLYEAKEDLIVMAMLYSDLCESEEQRKVIAEEIELLRKQQTDIMEEYFKRYGEEK